MFKKLEAFLHKLDHTVFDLEIENNYNLRKCFYDIKILHAVDIVFRVSQLSLIREERVSHFDNTLLRVRMMGLLLLLLCVKD